MVQFKSQFADTHFIIARQLLCNPEKHWTTLDFPDCHRTTVVRFLNELIAHNMVSRTQARGRSSYAVLTAPAALLSLCKRQFTHNEEKHISLFSQRNINDLLNNLTAAKEEFYLGRFSGVQKSLLYATESTLALLIPERKSFYGDRLNQFQMNYRLLQVKFGGNVNLILPRFKLFLRKYAVEQDGLKLPDDFYTYLYMASTDHPMAKPQTEYMEKKLGGINGNFLSWR